MNNRRTSRDTAWMVLGAAAGLLTWLYDYDFFFNAGGPKTPMSNAILRVTGTASASPLVVVLWPAVALAVVGVVGGFLMSRIFAVLRRRAAK